LAPEVKGKIGRHRLVPARPGLDAINGIGRLRAQEGEIMKTGIFGAGSIGCHIGGMLAAAGSEVVLVGRKTMGERLANGISLTHFDGSDRLAGPGSFAISADATALADCDVILVCVKSVATEEASETLSKIANPDALIVSLQNGISNAAVLHH
jgi:2-dehydropantoate 2-reductase